jgi:hypothetical protein
VDKSVLTYIQRLAASSFPERKIRALALQTFKSNTELGEYEGMVAFYLSDSGIKIGQPVIGDETQIEFEFDKSLGKPCAIVHSHPDSEAELSPWDEQLGQKVANETGLPFILFVIGYDEDGNRLMTDEMFEPETRTARFRQSLSNQEISALESVGEFVKYDRDENLDEISEIEYGSWQPVGNLRNANLFICKYMMYGDYDNSGAVERANYRVFLERYGDNPGILKIFGGYGTTGIAIKVNSLTDSMVDDLRGLANYPALDDEAVSEVEQELQDRAWAGGYRDEFRSLLTKKFDPEEEKDWSDGDLDRLFYVVAGRIDEDWRIETGGTAYIDVQKVAEAVTDSDMREHGLMTGETPLVNEPDFRFGQGEAKVAIFDRFAGQYVHSIVMDRSDMPINWRLSDEPVDSFRDRTMADDIRRKMSEDAYDDPNFNGPRPRYTLKAVHESYFRQEATPETPLVNEPDFRYGQLNQTIVERIKGRCRQLMQEHKTQYGTIHWAIINDTLRNEFSEYPAELKASRKRMGFNYLLAYYGKILR